MATVIPQDFVRNTNGTGKKTNIFSIFLIISNFIFIGFSLYFYISYKDVLSKNKEKEKNTEENAEKERKIVYSDLSSITQSVLCEYLYYFIEYLNDKSTVDNTELLKNFTLVDLSKRSQENNTITIDNKEKEIIKLHNVIPQTFFFVLNTFQNYKKVVDETVSSLDQDFNLNYEKYNTGSDPIPLDVDLQKVNEKIQSYKNSIIDFFDVKQPLVNEWEILGNFFKTLENHIINIPKVDRQDKKPSFISFFFKITFIQEYFDKEFISFALSEALFHEKNGIYTSDLGLFLIPICEILNKSNFENTTNGKPDDVAKETDLNELIRSLKITFLHKKNVVTKNSPISEKLTFANEQYDNFFLLIIKLLDHTDIFLKIIPHIKEYNKLYNEMHSGGKFSCEKNELRKKLDTLELELLPEIVHFATAFFAKNSKLFLDSTIIIRSYLFKLFNVCFKKSLLNFFTEEERKKINNIDVEDVIFQNGAFININRKSKVFIKLWFEEHIISKKTTGENPYKDLKIARVDLDQLRDAYIVMESSKGYLKRLDLLQRLKENYETNKIDSKS